MSLSDPTGDGGAGVTRQKLDRRYPRRRYVHWTGYQRWVVVVHRTEWSVTTRLRSEPLTQVASGAHWACGTLVKAVMTRIETIRSQWQTSPGASQRHLRRKIEEIPVAAEAEAAAATGVMAPKITTWVMIRQRTKP